MYATALLFGKSVENPFPFTASMEIAFHKSKHNHSKIPSFEIIAKFLWYKSVALVINNINIYFFYLNLYSKLLKHI